MNYNHNCYRITNEFHYNFVATPAWRRLQGRKQGFNCSWCITIMTDFIAPAFATAHAASVIFNFVYKNYLKVVAKLHISI